MNSGDSRNSDCLSTPRLLAMSRQCRCQRHARYCVIYVHTGTLGAAWTTCRPVHKKICSFTPQLIIVIGKISSCLIANPWASKPLIIRNKSQMPETTGLYEELRRLTCAITKQFRNPPPLARGGGGKNIGAFLIYLGGVKGGKKKLTPY